MNERKRVLFLCTGNSCRSQMAEGMLDRFYGHRFESLSAGIHPAGYIHPIAVEAMRQLGIDISRRRSKDLSEFLPPTGTVPDLVIGVCSSASDNCPVLPDAVQHWHWPFDDPAHATGTDQEILAEFIQVRDQIRRKLEETFDSAEVSVESPQDHIPSSRYPDGTV